MSDELRAPPARRIPYFVLGAVVAAALLQVFASMTWPPGVHEVEERYNAIHADLIRAGGLEMVGPLRYNSECVGCSVVASEAALLFSVLPESLASWRLVAWFWYLLGLVCAVGVATFLLGRPGGLVTALVFALPPPAWQELSVLSAGNHSEAGAILLLEVAVATFALGAQDLRVRRACCVLLPPLVLLGMAFIDSLLLGLLLLPLLAWVPGGWPELKRCLAVAAVPVAAVLLAWGDLVREPLRRVVSRQAPAGEEDWSFGLHHVEPQLRALFLPDQIEGIWGLGLTSGARLGLPALWALAGLLALGLLASRRGWRRAGRSVGPLAVALVGFVLLFCLYGRTIPSGGGVPGAGMLRYLGLVYPVLLLAAGLAAAALVSSGLAWRILGLLGLSVFLLPGGLERMAALDRSEQVGQVTSRRAAQWCYGASLLARHKDKAALLPEGLEPLDLVEFTRGFGQARWGEQEQEAPLAQSDWTAVGYAAGILDTSSGQAWEQRMSRLVSELESSVPGGALSGRQRLEASLGALWCSTEQDFRLDGFELEGRLAGANREVGPVSLVLPRYGALGSSVGPRVQRSPEDPELCRLPDLDWWAALEELGDPDAAWAAGWGVGAAAADRCPARRLLLDLGDGQRSTELLVPFREGVRAGIAFVRPVVFLPSAGLEAVD